VEDAAGDISISRVVTGLYASLLARGPKENEWDSARQHLAAGGSLEDIVRELLNSVEFQLGFFRNPFLRELVAPAPLPSDVPRLYIWHVPKTGGTSLREMLIEHIPPRQVCAGLTLSELYRLSPARLRSFRVISGHFGPALPRLLADVPLVTVTLIREPLQAIVSLYGELRRQGPEGHRASDLARRLPFSRWCRHEDTLRYWCNPQARLLAIERTPPAWAEGHESPEGEPPSVPDPELLERATRVLDAIDIVGTTDHLFEIYLESARRLGIDANETSARHVNVHDEEVDVPGDAAEWLSRRNRVDASLYEQARRRVQDLEGQQRSDYGPVLALTSFVEPVNDPGPSDRTERCRATPEDGSSVPNGMRPG
jgi:hypothetical protein